MAVFGTALVWDSLELIISVGFIAAYAHVLCFACSLVLRDEQTLDHSNDPDLPKKEQTAAYILTGFLAAIHGLMIFFGLPLLGHSEESFLMKVVFSCAILAASTTGLVIGGIALYLIVPAFYACARSLTRRVQGDTTKPFDIETASTADAEAKQGFLENVAE